VGFFLNTDDNDNDNNDDDNCRQNPYRDPTTAEALAAAAR
jgi:hypothetical protein